MNLRKFLRWGALTVGGALGLFLVALLIISAFGISISLDPWRGRIESGVTGALGRQVTITGPISLSPTLWPSLEIQGLRIANPQDWGGGGLLQVGLARGQLGVMALLGNRLRIKEIAAQDVVLILERRADGRENWRFDLPQSAPEGATEAADEGGEKAMALVAFDELSLRGVTLTLRDGASGQTRELRLDEVTGTAAADQDVELSIQGAYQAAPYNVSLRTGPLAHLMTPRAPWPIELSGEIAGMTLGLEGTVDEPLAGRGIAMDFSLSGDRLEDLEALTGAPFPGLGAFALRGQLGESDDGYRLSGLKGALGETALEGQLDLSLSGDRPRLAGELAVATLDVGPLLAGAPEPAIEEIPGDTDGIDEGPLPLAVLGNIDLDLALTVREAVNSPIEVRDASLRVHLEEGVLTAPMGVNIAQVLFDGRLGLDARGDAPALSIALSATGTQAGNLAEELTGAEGIEGSFERIDLSVSAQGATLPALLEGMNLGLTVNGASLSYGNVAGGQPVRFTLDAAQVDVGRSESMGVSARGTLLGEPLTMELSAGDLGTLLSGAAWPVRLSAKGGGATLQVEGTLTGVGSPDPSVLDVALEGERIGALSAWLGTDPSAVLSYGTSGRLVLTAQAWRLEALKAHIGRTRVSGELGWTGIDTEPRLVAALQFDTIDPDQLGRLFPPSESEDDAQGPGLTIDVPILPQDVSIVDADIDLSIKRILLKPSNITGVSLSSRIREGRVQESPFQAVVAGTSFKGDLALDLTGKVPEIAFNVFSDKVDIGGTLGRLGIVKDLEAKAGRLAVRLTTRGSRLRGILAKSDFSVGVRGGQWTLRDPATQGRLVIAIPSGGLQASAGQPITLTLDGRIDKTPVRIVMQSSSLTGFVDAPDRVPLRMTAEGAGARLELTTEAPLPLGSKAVGVTVSLAGDRLDSLDELLAAELPPWGPYSAGGRLTLGDSGYRLSDLVVRVGQSELTGQGSLETTGVPPQLDVALIASALQVNDFKVGDWSAFRGGAEEVETAQAEKPVARSGAGGEEADPLLSPGVMRALDARLSLRVEEVRSGEDRLGGGSLAATLEDGRFSLEPLQLDIPGGAFRMTLAYEPTDTDVGAEATAKIDRFDYGVLARRIDPETDMGGLLSLDLALKSRAPGPDALMQHAGGRLDFAIWPEDLEAGVFDLWAVNLVLAILPSLDEESTSRVNCVVGRFNLEDGRMRPDAILLDTTYMRVNGKGEVNFQTEAVDLTLKPRPKRPQFFSAATPVVVHGTISDFGVGVTPHALLGTVVRQLGSVVIVPLQWIVRGKLPADGADVCAGAMRRSDAELQESIDSDVEGSRPQAP